MLFGKISINCHIGVQDICNYLGALASERKILLPMNSRTAYDELMRIGMPADRKGYDYRTITKYNKKGVKAQRFHTFFFRSHSACHSHLIFTQKTQTEIIRDIQRYL